MYQSIGISAVPAPHQYGILNWRDGLIDRHDNSTWKHYYDLLPNHSMLLQHWKIGHWQSIWDIRQNPKVCDVFSKIWDVPKEELLVSFDGASFHIPPEITNRGHFRGKTWFHTDQRYSFNDLDCLLTTPSDF